MKLELNKAIWSVPVIVGGVLGLIISKPKQSQSSNMASPVQESIQEREFSLLDRKLVPARNTGQPQGSPLQKNDESKQPLDSYLLTAQSLLTKAVALSRDTQISADENAEGKTCGKENLRGSGGSSEVEELTEVGEFGETQINADNCNQLTIRERNQQIVNLINEAIDTTNQAIAEYPSSAPAYAQQAKIYQTITAYMPEAHQTAIAYYQQAIKIDDKNPTYYTSLAELYLTRINADMTTEAETSGKENLTQEKTSEVSKDLTSQVGELGEVEELTEVEESEEKPARLPEGDPRRLGNRDIQLAIYHLQKAVETDPTNPDRLKKLAEIQTRAGQIKQAKITYQRLLAILPDDDQKSKIKAEINSLNKLLAEAAASESSLQEREFSLLERTDSKVQDITLPDSPPKLQASHLAGINTIIAEPHKSKITNQNSTLETNAKSGSAVIPAGEKETEICNNHLGPDTQVYLVPESNENIILFVKSKSPYNLEADHCPNFIAATAKPVDTDLHFRWWIIAD